MARKDNRKLREMIKEYGIKDMKDVQEFVKMLTAETIQVALDAELENELGYSRYDYRNKKTDNSCPGTSVLIPVVEGSKGDGFFEQEPRPGGGYRPFFLPPDILQKPVNSGGTYLK